MKILKKEEITTSSNIGVTPENPPFGKLKIRHSDKYSKKEPLKRINVRMPGK